MISFIRPDPLSYLALYVAIGQVKTQKKRICRDFSRLELSIWGKKCKRAKNLLSNTTSKRDKKTQYLNSLLVLIKMRLSEGHTLL